MRAFIAIELPADAKRRVGEAIAELRQAAEGRLIRWADPETIHLTLRFLGEIDDTEAGLVRSVLDHGLAGRAGFSFQIGGELGCFPKWSRPRVFWIGVHGDDARLSEIYEIIESGLTNRGFDPESRAFHPHLTVGRIKRGAHRSEVAALSEALRQSDLGELGTVPVTEVSLMKSDLRPSGAVHSRIYHVGLGRTEP